MIDPQGQANKWIKNMEEKIVVLRPANSQNEIINKLNASIMYGQRILLENIGESIDNIFEPVLQKILVKSGGSYRIKFGDRLIEYNEYFKFYMTTKLPRPHYSPEICVKVTLLNF